MSSYDSSSSEAGPSIPRPKPRFTGWLTMAPTTDAPIASGSANASQNISSTSTTYDPIASTHGGNFVGGSLMYTSTSRSKPKSTKRAKKAASFHLADDADEHDERSSDGDSSSHSSSYSVESEDSPLFDVRASFAPMPRYAPRGAGGPTSKLETASSTFGAGPGAGETAEQAHQGLGPPARNGLQKLNGGGGIEYGGVQFKGKTAHAVEQEMEQLQDVSLMSHAPDAAYLASRLNMLKRNLEVEERMPSYVAYDEDILSEDEMVVMPDLVSTNTTAPVSNASTTSLLDDEEDEVPLDASLDLNVRITDHGSGSSSPSCKPIPIPGSKKRLASVELASSDFTSSCGTTMIDLSRAKAAALDARIEIRQLRRSDLEQVRDLHALHGDNDMSPDQQHNETYATTASFLLRLLVDDKHVCLVAVAKPIPEPTDLPSPFSIKPLASLPSSLGGSPSAAAASPSPSPSPLSSSPSSLSDASESLFSAPRGQDHAPSTFTGATTVSLGPEHSPSFSSEHYDGPRSELAGPTEVAPPSVVKVMAAPPPRGRTNPHTETVVGVASASLNVIRPGNDDFFGTLDEDSETETSLHPDTDADGSHTPRPEQPRSRSSTRTGNKVAKEAHILTLSILPSERSQGLGARLLDALLQECQVRSKSVGRRLIAPSSSSSPTTSTSSPAASKVGEEKGKKHGESGEVVQTLRTYLEVHPSNRRAIELYRSRGFQRPDGERGFRKGFYRGDIRIPVQERLKAGGMDAWVMERFS